VTTGLLDVLRLLARDSSCDGIMGFGVFHPRQLPISLKTNLTSVHGAPPPRRVNSGRAVLHYFFIPATCSAWSCAA
jgi:hypothetical protein